MANRTDLACESYEQQEKTALDGVIIRQTGDVTTVEVTNAQGARALGKPVGRYITYHAVDSFDAAFSFESCVQTLSGLLLRLMPAGSGNVLVVCLGNPLITADSIGPKVFQNILATRHLQKTGALHGAFRSVSALSAGVLSQTGIESAEIIAGVAAQTHPACIIAVDALAASSCTRLGTTVQISDSGIVPGSGVGNHRYEISQKTLGVPVIAMGIPTVVETSVLVGELAGAAAEKAPGGVFVTPREIDRITTLGARLVAMAINCALQPSFSLDEITSLLA